MCSTWDLTTMIEIEQSLCYTRDIVVSSLIWEFYFSCTHKLIRLGDRLHAAFTSTDRIVALNGTWKDLEVMINDCHKAQVRRLSRYTPFYVFFPRFASKYVIRFSWSLILQIKNDGSELGTELKSLIPRIGTFHTPLFVTEAFTEYNGKYCLTARNFVRPSFNEIRYSLRTELECKPRTVHV